MVSAFAIKEACLFFNASFFFSKEVRKVSGAFKTPNYRLQTWFLEGNQHHLKKPDQAYHMYNTS